MAAPFLKVSGHGATAIAQSRTLLALQNLTPTLWDLRRQIAPLSRTALRTPGSLHNTRMNCYGANAQRMLHTVAASSAQEDCWRERSSRHISAFATASGGASSPLTITRLEQPAHRRRTKFSSRGVSSSASEAPVADAPPSVEKPPPAPLTWKAAIDFKFIRDNVELVAANARNRKANADVAKVVALFEDYSRVLQEVERVRAARNNVAAQMKGKLEQVRRAELIEEGKHLKDRLAAMDAELDALSEQLQREGQRIPNLTHPDVPIGGEEVAALRKMVGSKREFAFPPKDHVELGVALDIVDFDTAAEVSGQKFYYLKNAGVLLEMALVNWALTRVAARGFTPLITPDLVRESVVEKCGFQPRGENTQVYSIEGSPLCLAGTAEVLVGGMFMERVLAEGDLPTRVVAVSHCFRTEAGAAGAAGRGLYRVHQFTKVEMFALCKPEDSDAVHEELISLEEELYSSLGLHFKTLDMSSEDLGAPAYRKFDVEAWMPGLDRYGEISSASNCTDYQARRLNIRFRPTPPPSVGPPSPTEPGKGKGKKAGGTGGQTAPATQFVHTLNATACAVPRMIVAILENFQQEDGSVVVPEPLRPFMGGMDVIRPPTTKK